jgi:hypothetical protein
MAFYLPLPQVCVKLEENFVVDEVRTKSSLAEGNISPEDKEKYIAKIKAGSMSFLPDSEKTYIVCMRIASYTKRDADNVAKGILDILFPPPKGDSIDIVKGIQAEGELVNDKQSEQSEVYIYSILCQRQNS